MNNFKLFHAFAKQFALTTRSTINFTTSAAHSYPNTSSSSDVRIASTSSDNKEHTTDELLQTIKTTRNAYELFSVVTGQEMTGKRVLQTLRSLYNLQKIGEPAIRSSQIIKHPEFEPLCRALKRHCRAFELSETLDALKFLSYLTVSPDSEILTILLNLIRYEINDLELNQIVFLDFLLNKFESSETQTTALIEALKIALPIVFDLNLSLKLDHENVLELISLLAYAIKNNLKEKSINSLITSLTLHGTRNLTADQSLSILIILLDLKDANYFNYAKLIGNCYQNIIKHMNSFKFNDLDLLLGKIVRKLLRTQNFELFYNQLLFDKLSEYLIETNADFSHTIYMVKKFNRISHINIKLLDYLCNLIAHNQELITSARLNSMINFVTASAIVNYPVAEKLPNFDEIVFENNLFQNDRIELPWLKLTLELLALNCYNTNLIIKIFNGKFLTKFLARENNFLDHLQLLLIYQTVTLLYRHVSEGNTDQNGYLNNEHIQMAKQLAWQVTKSEYPLKSFLEYSYNGNNFVATNVKTRCGHVLDHVLVFDRDSNALDISTTSCGDGDEIWLEQILERYPHKENKIIAITGYSKSCYALNIGRLKGIFELQTRTIEALNVIALPINIDLWSTMPEHERLPFLTQEIGYKLNNKTP